MPQRIFERVVWVGAVAIIAIILAGAIAYSRVQSLSDSTRWLERSQRIQFALQRSMSAVQDAESAVRGYYITREEPFLAPYSAARTQLDDELSSLTSLLADTPDQLARLRELAGVAHARLDSLDATLAAIRAGTFVLPKAPVAAAESKRLMDQFRSLIATMQGREDGQLAARGLMAARARQVALASTVSLSGIAAALVVLLLLVSRRAARDIRHSEQWLATTLDSIGDGVIATDGHGAIRFMNRIASELTGWSQSDAQGRPLGQVFKMADGALIRRDGAEFPIEDSSAPIRGDGNRINGAVMVFKDASAARAAQQAVGASEERLRLALEGAELGAVDHDLRTGRAVWNDRLYNIVGYPAGTSVSVEMINLHTAAEDWQQVQQTLQHAREARVPFRSEHRIVRASDKAVRWISSNGIFLYDREGRAIRFIGVVRDITENRKLESQLRQAQKLDALGTLAGGIAHDFNNILAVLRGNLSVVKGALVADESVTPALNDMENACNRATALVRQILTFGRQQDQDRLALQLEDVVADAVQLLRATLPAQIEIRSSYASDLPAVLADPNQIHQVITNLAINATQAIGPRPGLIDIRLDALQVDAELASTPDLHEGRYVRVSFSDNGGGMPREVMERIFEPFFTTKSPNAGTGLGLSVVRGILKNHDAAIAVYSEPTRGTRFHLYFPAVDDRAHTVALPRMDPQRGHDEHVLYLDDEESLVVLAKRMLERMGYRITGFSEPSTALAAFEATPADFDLVLTDLSMPGMSGMEFSRRILSIRPDIPVLLTTGYVRNEDIEQARAIGIREVIWKPQTVAEMGDLLALQLEKLVLART